MDTIELYAIRDNVAGEFGPIYASKNSATAVRSYQQMLKKEVVENAHDFSLYFLGTYNRRNGRIVGVDPTAVDVIVETVKAEFSGAELVK